MSSFRTPLAVLAAGALVLGTSELGVAGLLPAIGAGLHVTAASAGLLVTAYAVAVAVGGPVLTALLRRHDARRVLVAALLAMAAGNALTATVPWYPAVLAARALTGAAAAVYAVAALGAAGAIAGPDRQGRAVAIVFGGVAVSSVLGVPLCSLLAGWIGWRSDYLLLAAASLAVIPAVPRTLHPTAPNPPTDPTANADPIANADRIANADPIANPDPVGDTGGLAGGSVAGGAGRWREVAAGRWVAWFGPARPGRLLGMFGVNAAVQTAQYAVGTYLVVMAEAAGLRGGAVAALLLSAGVAGVAGIAAGGRLADRHAGRAVVAATAVLAGVLAVVPLALGHPALLWVAAVVWTLAAAAFSAAAQVRVAEEVSSAGGVAGAANISVGNVGIATGSALGGAALRVVGPPGPALFGAVLATAGLAGSLALLGRRPWMITQPERS
jgi:predicted MFS family arabinose efflux permease